MGLIKLLILTITEFQFQFRHVILSHRRHGSIGTYTVEPGIIRGILTEVTNDGVVRYTVIMLAAVRQFGITQIRCPRVFLPLDGQEHIIFTGVHVLLPQLVDVIHVFKTERVHRKFLTVRLSVVERIFHQGIILHLVVLRSVCRISLYEPILTQLRGRSPSHAETGTFDGITIDSGIHRTKLKLVLIRHLTRRNIARHQDRNHFLRHGKERDRTQFRHQLLHRVRISLDCFLRTNFFPKILRTAISLFLRNNRCAFLEYLFLPAFRCLKRLMGIYIQTSRIKAFRFLTQLKIHTDVIFRNDTGTIRLAFEVLRDSHSGNEIQIDILCHIEYRFTDKISGVQRHI